MPPLRTLTLAIVLLFSHSLLAQKKDSLIQKEIFSKQLDDIVIFGAEKKQKKLLKTPSSVTQISSGQIQSYRLWDIANLKGIAPNFNLANSGDNRNIAGIRGIVTTSYDQSVATYIDGVAQFNLDTYIPQLNDIESIEILRGPQSTFYGRNSMGGVINITTKAPTNQSSLLADMSIGNAGQKRFSAQYKAPILKDKLFFSTAYLNDVKNGFYTNDFISEKYDRQRQNMTNIQLKYIMKNNWTIQADYKYYKSVNDGAFPLNGDLASALSNPFHLSQNQVTSMNDQTNNASVVLQHKGEKVNVVLQTSYQNNYRYYDNTLDADFSEFEIIGIYNNYGKSYNNVNAITNELRIQSADKNDTKLKWSTGIYQYNNFSPTKQATVFGGDAGFIGIPDTDFSIISFNLLKTDGVAGYAHAEYQLNNKISLQVGARLDYENRALTIRSDFEKQPSFSFTMLKDTTGKKNYVAFSPKVGLNYTVSDNQFLYFNYSRGFRSGGLSSISSDPSQIPLASFLPEFSNMFEIGFKGVNKLKTLQYSIAGFYNHVTNIQTPFLILPDAVTITKNAGDLRSSGIEWEISAKPSKELTLQYNAGIVNAKYKTFTTVSNGTQVNLNNKRQIFTPTTSQFLTATYKKKIGKMDFWSNIQYQYSGTQYFDFANTIKQDAYGLLHAQIGFKFSKLSTYVWARNITDVKYISYAYDFGAVHLGNPRTFGVGLSYKIL